MESSSISRLLWCADLCTACILAPGCTLLLTGVGPPLELIGFAATRESSTAHCPRLAHNSRLEYGLDGIRMVTVARMLCWPARLLAQKRSQRSRLLDCLPLARTLGFLYSAPVRISSLAGLKPESKAMPKPESRGVSGRHDTPARIMVGNCCWFQNRGRHTFGALCCVCSVLYVGDDVMAGCRIL